MNGPIPRLVVDASVDEIECGLSKSHVVDEMIYTRRQLCGGLVLGGIAATSLPAWAANRKLHVEKELRKLEARSGGKLGVAITDFSPGTTFSHRGNELFPMCSTVKFLSAALVLNRVDRGRETLDRVVEYNQADLVTYSPITEKHVGRGMSVRDLCKAAITLSDNTAQNLLFASFGGPKALTNYARSLGDSVTRSDRRETELNSVAPGDMRDSTSPAAMLGIMRRTLVGRALARASQRQLIEWMLATTTGDKRLSAHVPLDWRTGDKTGTGPRNATNDIAIFLPPRRSPIVVTAFYVDSPAPLKDRENVLAEVGRLAAGTL